MVNKERDLVLELILDTYINVFLTGKAGTGKTTLLKEILEKTDKKAAVVAPTGVSAINAKGMTIHSFFQLPITSFIPNNDAYNPDQFINRIDLASQQKIRKERRKLLINLELLVIDEISMVRADLLDAIDFTLRRLKQNSEPFGGIQLLVIGDLSQLSPIISREDWHILSRYFHTPYFFSSHAWKNAKSLRIELKHIYRQTDQSFINILNNVRIGKKVKSDIDTLNNQVITNPQDLDGVITLTTHNRSAQNINTRELNNLKTKSFKLTAKVTGQFNPSSFPTDETIELKEGAQVMFIRNNMEAGYYNGKIAQVVSKLDDKVIVKCNEDNSIIEVEPLEWSNSRYKLDSKINKVVQEEIGAFKQYPLKLAWAVTVHKSQGLTFDEVILDVDKSFAAGQLYVALSRCRSLAGIHLLSPISEQSIIIDKRITQYNNETTEPEDIDFFIATSKLEAERKRLLKAFRFIEITSDINDWIETIGLSSIPEKGKVAKLARSFEAIINILDQTGKSFQRQLTDLFDQQSPSSIILERCEKAIKYFTDELYNKYVKKLEAHISAYKVKKNSKKHIRLARTLTESAWSIIEQLYDLHFNNQRLYTDSDKHEKVILFDPDKKLPSLKMAKGETYQITLDLYERGFGLDDISTERGMARSTIESHMAKLLRQGKVKIEELLPDYKIKKIREVLLEAGDSVALTDIKYKLGDDYSFGDLRMVQSYIAFLSKDER